VVWLSLSLRSGACCCCCCLFVSIDWQVSALPLCAAVRCSSSLWGLTEFRCSAPCSRRLACCCFSAAIVFLVRGITHVLVLMTDCPSSSGCVGLSFEPPFLLLRRLLFLLRRDCHEQQSKSFDAVSLLFAASDD